MTFFLGMIGLAFIGGLVAALTGGLTELVRALTNAQRRSAILERGIRANIRQFLA